jgi:hypothetical protein
MARKTNPDKPRRDPNDRPLKSDKRVSLAPLSFEEALGGILQAGPHPKDDETEQVEDTEKAPRKGRLRGTADDVS